jgi:putative membrane protein
MASEDRNSLLLRWAINAAALWAAVALLDGVEWVDSGFVSVALTALIFGLVNALIRPIITILTCPLIILTLGLGTLLINTAMFALTGWLGEQFSIGFNITGGFWSAFFGALIVTIVSAVLSAVLGGGRRHRQPAD